MPGQKSVNLAVVTRQALLLFFFFLKIENKLPLEEGSFLLFANLFIFSVFGRFD